MQVNVTMPPSTSSGSNVAPQSVNSLQAAGAPGTNPYNTQVSENVNYSGTQTIKTNPAIQAPGLTTTLSDTCMGSVSLGVSFPGFGATGGTTLVDQACVRRLDAREFRAMGLTDVALALLCQSDANRRAVEAAGHLCPGTTAPLARSNVAPSAEATVADDVKYHDPIVRNRMGLPPLDAAVPASGQARPIAATAVQPAPIPPPLPVAASSTGAPSANAAPAAPLAAAMKASPAIAAVPAAGAAPIAEAASVRGVAPAATNAIPAAAIVAAPAAADKAPEAAPAIADKAPIPVPATAEKAPEPAPVVAEKAADPAPTVAEKAPEPVPTVAEKAPEPAPVVAEKAADPAPTVAEKAPEPVPTVAEKAPEPAPVVAEKAAEPAPAVVDKTPEPAPVVTEKAPEPPPATDNAAQATPAAEIPAVAPAPADQEAAPAMQAPAVFPTSTSSEGTDPAVARPASDRAEGVATGVVSLTGVGSFPEANASFCLPGMQGGLDHEDLFDRPVAVWSTSGCAVSFPESRGLCHSERTDSSERCERPTGTHYTGSPRQYSMCPDDNGRRSTSGIHGARVRTRAVVAITGIRPRCAIRRTGRPDANGSRRSSFPTR
ncbi:hypothetical protein BvRS1_38030 [Burkholderia vietnamiensis]|nr:hypothetical protein BvRS1_38030 [Burkholderia vietnamiensis]